MNIARRIFIIYIQIISYEFFINREEYQLRHIHFIFTLFKIKEKAHTLSRTTESYVFTEFFTNS